MIIHRPRALPPPPRGYRPNVGLLVLNKDGLALIGRRRNSRGPYAWQAPQGGIDRGENVQAAAFRELEEETGIPEPLVVVIDRTNDWLTYDFPEEMQRGRYRQNKGQAQVWFAFRFMGTDADVRLDAHSQVEFDDWRWERLEALPDLVIPFKRGVYETMAQLFAPHTIPVEARPLPYPGKKP
jgi:putative (di)nucleoside polyphosphate hydrolase